MNWTEKDSQRRFYGFCFTIWLTARTVQNQRGYKQWDPVGPYLFLIYVKILTILIKQNLDIRGIIVNGSEHTISEYAEDTLLILDGSQKHFLHLLIL